jgi:hypothetical protein
MATATESFAAMSLGVSQTMTLWTALMPPLAELRETTSWDDPNLALTVRHTELVVGAVALSIGAVGSAAFRTSAPLIATLVTFGVLAFAYEYTLRSEPIESRPIGELPMAPTAYDETESSDHHAESELSHE